MDSFLAWMVACPLSRAFSRNAPWAWPMCESIHFIGLVLVIGSAGFFDLRLLGVIRGVSVNAVKQFIPLSVVGFVMNLLTGMYFFIAQPNQYMENRAWGPKLFFLALAGLNALIFQAALGEKAVALGPGEPTPLSFKIIGGISLFSWFAVLYFGRMLAFLGLANAPSPLPVAWRHGNPCMVVWPLYGKSHLHPR